MSDHSGSKKLGWFLCWAVVFADIGTSLYYVPGILYGEVGNLAGLFVILSSIVFVLLVMKYIEITDRYAEGGGVVTVATHAFNHWIGALGGMFITVDYFLTAAISSVSGFAYLNSVINLGNYILVAAIIGIILLGILNVIGIKESAGVTAVVATAAFVVDIILVVLIATQIGPDGWKVVFGSIGQVSQLTPWAIMTGFAGSFLAFSGLESISQLSPAMATPRKKVATIAMVFVVGAILITSPLLTLFSTNLLTAKVPGTEETILDSVQKVKEREIALANAHDEAERIELEHQIKEGKEYSERFMSELGAQYGGTAIKIAVVATASVLLLFASNTAIIGAYHVFITLSRQKFLPKLFQDHNTKFDTPHWAVLLAVVPPILIIIGTKGDMNLLGQLYAFGLLGAFALSSIGLDVVRWKEDKKVTLNFALGILTSVLVMIAWVTNLYHKQLATVFGSAITIAGMIIAYFVHNYYSSSDKVADHAEMMKDIKIEKIKSVPSSQIFVPVYDEFDKSLFEFASNYAKNANKSLVIMYIRQYSDILQTVSENFDLDEEAAKFIKRAAKIAKANGVEVHELYKSTSETGDLINYVRDTIKPAMTIISPSTQSEMIDFLKGDIIKKVTTHANGNVLIYTGSQK